MQQSPTWPALVLLQPANDLRDAPLAALNTGLARQIVTDFGDDVLHLVVVEGEPPGPDRQRTADQPALQYLSTPSEPTAAANAILAALPEALSYAYTLLDLSGKSVGFNNFLVDFLAKAAIPAGLHLRLVRLRGSAPPFVLDAPTVAPIQWSVLATEFIEPVDREAMGEWLGSVVVDKVLTRLGLRDPTTAPTTPNPLPGARRHEYPEEVRIQRLWSGDARESSWSRWARAVTRRRVGVALGGSGAWGFAHAALINRFEELDIPIDIVASASSGSVIGGYYTALGPDGIEKVLRRGWRLDFAVFGCVFTMASLELMVGWDTGFNALNDFELMFFPVTTNLTTMSSDRVVNASLPWGVRASSSAPGGFAPTTSGNAVFVDGAVANNVPSEVVEWIGAAMVVASNALPAPRNIKRPCNLIRDLSPIFRARELASSLALMFHDVGDWQSTHHICYDPPQSVAPLSRTFMFNQARQVYDETLTDAGFQATIRKSQAAWEALARARTGL